MAEIELEFVDEDDTALQESETEAFSDAVLYSSDWTVETVISQLKSKNIDLNPRFQRRDAWTLKGKSRFIESIIIGLPIPQIVLAEKKGQRGQFIVLDGKQRLLALLQFTGQSEGDKNGFGLSGMEARTDLSRKRFSQLQKDPARRDDLNIFFNNTIRTVVIRNWPNTAFLHLVFLRLNTGSVKLSPQELRQAMVPGPFSDFIDDIAMDMKSVQRLLSRTNPDPRMRDVELLVRYLSFRRFLAEYGGRMKEFLDNCCASLNEHWNRDQNSVYRNLGDFDAGLDILFEVFGDNLLARKIGSKSFNRAIFDVLIFYATDQIIREAMLSNRETVLETYNQCLSNQAFLESVESDTAGIPHTYDRLAIWGTALRAALGIEFNVPTVTTNQDGSVRINFAGFR
ncbi:GmrSD restriction endonuclease domain-containing protein [Glacieibacterium frigidum]|uniref:DUF262 domain-containing protein n=1 Tax=Glacieibacterium frigidum TaxID=2593303 RepID=A0A552UIM6_9SPHN|nr:DUF262 domain-containing protein [Glacieibacterium frigidum]TRW18073.1 DUF262 domain-containing protein [Glacieibacterium frigidum]